MAPEKGERSNGVYGRKGEAANGRIGDAAKGGVILGGARLPLLPETFNEANDVVDSQRDARSKRVPSRGSAVSPASWLRARWSHT